jgi:SAM-dependent methyltransferase
MSFEDVMANVQSWIVATDAAAALAAELKLQLSGQSAPADIDAALRAVSVAAGLTDLDALTPEQRGMVVNRITMSLRHANELVDNPARAAGWVYTDPAILDGWGRASMMIPMLIAQAIPELGDVTQFLDVGVGVGLLAVAAAGMWPNANVVGIDIWEPSLQRARAHVADAQLGDRIALRTQDIVDVDDTEAFDLIWVPTFFLSETILAAAMPGLVRALRPGGRIVLGRFAPPPDPLVEATQTLQTLRGGGFDLEAKRAIELLEQTGCQDAHAAPRTMPIPMELVVAQKSGS